MLFKPNPASGMPIYLQLMEQVKHAIAVGAIHPGEQLPGIRRVAEDLVMNPNTVAKAYRELEHEGVIELRHGSGAFVLEVNRGGENAGKLQRALPIVQAALEKLGELGLSEEEIRLLVEGELRAAHGVNTTKA